MGKESIRIWKLKANGNMIATSITLDKSGRDRVFNDFAFEIGKDVSGPPIGDKKNKKSFDINALRVKNILAVTLSG